MDVAFPSNYKAASSKGKRPIYQYKNDSYEGGGSPWYEIPRKNLTLLSELGSGAFGVVYKADLLTDTGDVLSCAVKTLKRKNNN